MLRLKSNNMAAEQGPRFTRLNRRALEGAEVDAMCREISLRGTAYLAMPDRATSLGSQGDSGPARGPGELFVPIKQPRHEAHEALDVLVKAIERTESAFVVDPPKS